MMERLVPGELTKAMEALATAYAGNPAGRIRLHTAGQAAWPDFPSFDDFWALVDHHATSLSLSLGAAICDITHGRLWRQS